LPFASSLHGFTSVEYIKMSKPKSCNFVIELNPSLSELPKFTVTTDFLAFQDPDT